MVQPIRTLEHLKCRLGQNDQNAPSQPKVDRRLPIAHSSLYTPLYLSKKKRPLNDTQLGLVWLEISNIVV